MCERKQERISRVTISNTSAMRRYRQRRLKRTLATAVGLLLVYLAGLAGYTLANSSFFDLAAIKIEGNAVITRDEIIAASGLRFGSNLLKVSREQATANILSLPYIKEAEISRVFPDKVEIRISERAPLALINADGRYLVMDENGYCLMEVSPVTAESWELPTIRCGIDAVQLQPGERSEDKGVRAALALIQNLDPFFMENILVFDAPSAEKLAIINRDGLTVYFGLPEDLDRKLQNYEDLLIKNQETCNASTLQYVDLRYDTQITLHWK